MHPSRSLAVLLLVTTSLAAAATTYELEPRFTLGLDDDVLLGRPIDVALHPGGSLLVLDAQLAVIHVVDPSGGSIGEIGRPGQGPGELQNPVCLFLDPDGTIVVPQAAPARLVRYAIDRRVLGAESLDLGGGVQFVLRARRGPDTFVYEQASTEFDGQTVVQLARLLARVDTDEEPIELAVHSTEIDMNRRVFREGEAASFSATWTVTTDGAVVWSTHPTDYAVRRHHPQTGAETELTRPDYRPVVRTDHAKERWVENAKNGMRRASSGMDFDFEPLDEEPFLRGIHARPEGAVWIRRTAASFDGFDPSAPVERIVFDHFDADGTFVGEVHVRCPQWMAQSRLFLFDDLVVTVHHPDDEDDELRPVTVDAFTLREAP